MTMREEARPLAEPAPARRASGDLPERWFWAGLLAAFICGAAIRLYYVFSSHFPMHDGGLFLVMMRDLEASNYGLPEFTTYNGGDIPFAYPPLGLYAGAFLDRLTALSTLDVLHYLPAVVSLASILAFALLARTMLSSRTQTVLATIAFAVLPRSTMWMIMGGGLTRAFGFLFALLALQQAYLLFSRRNARYLPLSVLFAGLTVLSHMEMAVFLAASLAIMVAFLGRNRTSLVHAAALAGGTLVLAAPWWISVIARHGLDVMIAPAGSRPIIEWNTLNILSRFDITNEIFFPFLTITGILGVIVCLAQRRYFLPVWLLLIGVPAPWIIATQVVVPLALLIGIGVTELLLPALGGLAQRVSGDSESLHPLRVSRLQGGVLAFMLIYTVATAIVVPPPILNTIQERQRQQLAWVGENTPPGSRILVIEEQPWWANKVSEWLPALSGRISVATPQGLEWTKRGAFDDMINAYEDAQNCGYQDVTCLQDWSQETGIDFTYVYLPKWKAVDPDHDKNCCYALRNSLYNTQGVRIIYDGPAATIAQIPSRSG